MTHHEAMQRLAQCPEDLRDTRRLPPWLRTNLPRQGQFARTLRAVEDLAVGTVCQAARCPNMFECFGCGLGTFLILGPRCSRHCRFCNVLGGAPAPVDPDEPRRVAEAAARLGLKHVVITSVTRDDLPDGGAGHFVRTMEAVRQACPQATVEVLVPDFCGDRAALEEVLAARPDVFNHNLETVPRLYALVRPQADWQRSLKVLARAVERGMVVKTGIMVGLGEEDTEVLKAILQVAELGCRMMTVGQYLRPSRQHLPVARYVHPQRFAVYAAYGQSLGIASMACAPLVRSSYHAGEGLARLAHQKGG